jgi:hypothetical protein
MFSMRSSSTISEDRPRTPPPSRDNKRNGACGLRSGSESSIVVFRPRGCVVDVSASGSIKRYSSLDVFKVRGLLVNSVCDGILCSDLCDLLCYIGSPRDTLAYVVLWRYGA